jgi:aspartyl-tRNA(Asn)/glutamyl-tRNA(Gln) amidotransferase subunit B
VRPLGSDKLGTRCEIKNLNSFRFLEKAIEFEVRRQIEIIEDGGKITQETRLYDPDKDETRSMRSKEDAHDYRYFPDPDLLPLAISEATLAEISATLPELPQAKCARFGASYGLTAYDASQLTASRELADYFENAARGADARTAKLCANWITGNLNARLNDENLDIAQSKISSTQLRRLVDRIADGSISGNSAKSVFEALWAGVATGDDAAEKIIIIKGLHQISDTGAIEKIVDEVLVANAQQVADYKAGKEKAFNSLVGQAMKATKGKANPQQVNELLKRKLAQ